MFRMSLITRVACGLFGGLCVVQLILSVARGGHKVTRGELARQTRVTGNFSLAPRDNHAHGKNSTVVNREVSQFLLPTKENKIEV